MTPPDSNVVNGWVALLTPVALAVMTVVQLIIGKIAATKVSEVKDTLAATNNVTTDKLDAIHKLVNSEYGIALRTAAIALERIAQITKRPSDIAIAAKAREASIEQDNRQHAMDASVEAAKAAAIKNATTASN